MSELKEVLMNRDNLTSDEADEVILDLSEQVMNGADPEEVLYSIGLEPDYVFDII